MKNNPRRPRRVLVVCHLALPHVGGVENVVDLEVRALAEAGHEVLLLTSDGTGAGRVPRYPACVRVVRVPAWHLPERRFGVPYPLFGPGLLGALWNAVGWCDVVHAHGFMFPNSALAVWLARLRGKPSILTDHGGIQRFASRAVTLLARLGAETVGRLTATLATRVVTFNARIRDQLARLGRRGDVEFLVNPIDLGLFRPPTPEERTDARRELGWVPGRAKVLYAGRLIPAKGVPLLASATDAEYDLVFCGPGDVSLLGPVPRPGIEYLPPRPQAELLRLYHAADALGLPADTREGFPLVVQEAIACGLPVALGYDPGFEPYRGWPGLVFCERTTEDVRSAVKRALAIGRSPDGAADVCLPLADWVRQLYRFPDDPARMAEPLLPATAGTLEG